MRGSGVPVLDIRTSPAVGYVDITGTSSKGEAIYIYIYICLYIYIYIYI